MTGAWGVDIYVLQTCRIAEEVEGCEVLAGCHSDSILMSSSRAEMSSMSSIAITRLGRLNSRNSHTSSVDGEPTVQVGLSALLQFFLWQHLVPMGRAIDF